MPNITNTTADVFLAEVFSKEVIRETNPKLVLAKLVKRFDDEARMGNDSISVPSITNFVANDKVSNIPVSFQANTETDIVISIDQHKETSFLLEDITELQSKQDLMAHYTDAASTAIARAIDTSLAALALGFSTATGAYNTAITTDVVLNSIESLDLADCPEDDRSFVFRSDVKRDLLDLAAYTSSDFVGGKPTESGNIGRLYGVDTFMSNNLIFTGGTNRNNMLFHKDALALAMAQQPRAQAEYSVSQLGHELVVDTVYGVRELRDDFGVLVRT
jgi:hypothetical protein